MSSSAEVYLERLWQDGMNVASGNNTIGATKDAGTAYETTLTYTASADATTPVAITGAPASGQFVVIDDIIVSVDTAMNIEFELEDSANTNYVKLYMLANSSYQLTTRGKFKLGTADKKLMIDASVAGNIAVTVLWHSEA